MNFYIVQTLPYRTSHSNHALQPSRPSRPIPDRSCFSLWPYASFHRRVDNAAVFGATHPSLETGIAHGAYHPPRNRGLICWCLPPPHTTGRLSVPTTTPTKTGPSFGAYRHAHETRDPHYVVTAPSLLSLGPDEEDDADSVESVDPRDLVSSDEDEIEEPPATADGNAKGSVHDTASAGGSLEESDS
jgi:hypothetical protein